MHSFRSRSFISQSLTTSCSLFLFHSASRSSTARGVRLSSPRLLVASISSRQLLRLTFDPSSLLFFLRTSTSGLEEPQARLYRGHTLRSMGQSDVGSSERSRGDLDFSSRRRLEVVAFSCLYFFPFRFLSLARSSFPFYLHRYFTNRHASPLSLSHSRCIPSLLACLSTPSLTLHDSRSRSLVFRSCSFFLAYTSHNLHFSTCTHSLLSCTSPPFLDPRTNAKNEVTFDASIQSSFVSFPTPSRSFERKDHQIPCKETCSHLKRPT